MGGLSLSLFPIFLLIIWSSFYLAEIWEKERKRHITPGFPLDFSSFSGFMFPPVIFLQRKREITGDKPPERRDMSREIQGPSFPGAILRIPLFIACRKDKEKSANCPRGPLDISRPVSSPPFFFCLLFSLEKWGS